MKTKDDRKNHLDEVYGLVKSLNQDYDLNLTVDECKNDSGRRRIEIHNNGQVIGDTWMAMTPKTAMQALWLGRDLMKITATK